MTAPSAIQTGTRKRTSEEVVVCVEMAKREWGYQHLAARCGVAAVSLRTQANKGWPRARVRLLVEHRGLEMPVWSTPAEFRAKRQQIEQLGDLPEFMTFRTIQNLASRHGLPGWSAYRSKAELAAALTKFLARRPSNPLPS